MSRTWILTNNKLHGRFVMSPFEADSPFKPVLLPQIRDFGEDVISMASRFYTKLTGDTRGLYFMTELDGVLILSNYDE